VRPLPPPLPTSLPARQPCKSLPITVDLPAEFIRLSKTNECRFRTWWLEERVVEVGKKSFL
jgi:hypothetical protein